MAFPSVLAQMDRNMQWTTDLGNAYYNQPQDVMDAVQQMRQRAQQAGSLESTQQQTVSNDDGEIAIAPSNPEVVYVPVYNPWVVYGPPVVAWPGYYYAPPPGIFFGVGFGFRIGFGWGIPVRPWAPWGWGWHSWGCGWANRTVVYNRTTYITRSTTVINRGYSRPGAPPLQLGGTARLVHEPSCYTRVMRAMWRRVRDQCLCRMDLRTVRAITTEPGTSIIVRLPSLGITTMCSSRRITGLRPRPMGLRTAAVLLLLRRETFSSGQRTLLRRPTTVRHRARRPIAALLKVRRRIVLRRRRTTAVRALRHLLHSAQMSAPHSAPAPHAEPHGGGGGDHRH